MISSELLPPWCLLEMARPSLLTSATAGQGPALCWCPVGWGPPSALKRGPGWESGGEAPGNLGESGEGAPPQMATSPNSDR